MKESKQISATQLEKLITRMEKIEAKLAGKGKHFSSPTNGDEKELFCSMPQVPERTFEHSISQSRERLIRMIGKKWVNGTKLRYYFFDTGSFAGASEQKNLVREGFEVWKDVGIGISFEEVTDISEAEIRIGFLRGDGSWSFLGRDLIDIPGQNERTMNFGWDLTRDPRGVDTPVHEIGHTLGFPHEHQNPFGGIKWDEEAVYEYFGGSPNFWDPQTTFYNVLRKLSPGEVEGSDWDADSIMHYGFPAGLIEEPVEYSSGLQPELGLSEGVIEQVRLFYPPLDERSYPELKPLQSQTLSLAPAEQKNFMILPSETRDYKIQTFGQSDTVMVLFEDQEGDLKFVDGDDDSGTDLNSSISTRLYQGRKYILRIRLYSNFGSGDAAVMLW